MNESTTPNPNRCNRRQFVANSAFAAASVTLLKPSSVFGAAANSKVEVGCIGLGGRGSLIASMVAKHDGYKITGLADYFPQVVDAAGERLGVSKERRFTGLSGYKKLIAAGVDAVFCETPPYCFPDHVEAAISAGRHVYMAKPVACDVPGCQRILEAGKKAKGKQAFLVDFQTRTNPFYIEAVKRVQAGDAGALGMLSTWYFDEAFSDPPRTDTASRLRHLIWVNDIDLGGDYIVNCDIHAIDVALWIAGGPPVTAMGCSRRCDPGAHGDAARAYAITYEFPKGLILSHRGEHMRNASGFHSVCVAHGSEGYLESNYGGKVWIRSNKETYEGGECPDLYNDGIARNIDTFHRSIVNRAFDNVTVEASVNSTLASILGRDAGARNGRLTWDEMVRENKRVEPDLTGLKD